MRKISILILTVFFVAICAGCTQLLSDDEQDSRTWDRIVKEEITKQQIKRIEVYTGPRKRIIPPENHKFVVAELKAAKFYKSNRQGFGPTPESSVVLHFKNGAKLALSYLEGGIFEHSRTINGTTSQFLILSEKLGNWHKRFIEWPPPIPRDIGPETAIYYYGAYYHPASAIIILDTKELRHIGNVRINHQIAPVFVKRSDSGKPKNLYARFKGYSIDNYKIYMPQQ